jgi:hypothetical protein
MKQGKEAKHTAIAVPLPHLTRLEVAGILTLMVVVFFRDILFQNAFFWEDFIYQYYAFRNFAAVSLAHGTLPLWNPYTFNGMPFQADIQTALFYLPNLLLTLAVSSGKLYFLWVEVLIIAHFIIAGYAMYLLVQEFGLERGYALFAGVAYMLSGFMIMQVIHQTFVCQVAWTPLILLALHRALRRRSVFWMILAGIVLGHSILAGSPQFTVYVLLLLFGYFLFELVPVVRAKNVSAAVRMSMLAGGMIVVALGITALQLLPTQELAGLSQRAEITFQKSSEGSLRFQQLLTLIVPKYFGASGAQGSGFWLEGNYWEYWETCIYLGLLPLVLVVASFLLLRKNRVVAFFTGVLVFGILYSFGDNFFLHSFFFKMVPGFDKFRVPGRMSFFVTFAGAILSGFGLKHLFELRQRSPKTLRNLALGVAAAGVAVYLLGNGGFLQPAGNARMFEQVHPGVVHETGVALLFAVLIGGLLFLVLRGILSPTRFVLAAIVLHLVDMMLFGYDQNNGQTNPELYYQRTSELVSFLKDEGAKEYFRINSRLGGAMLLDRNQGMVDRIFMCEGYTPLALQRNYPLGKPAYDLLNAKYRIAVDNQKQTAGIQPAMTYLPRAFLVDSYTVLTNEEAERRYLEGSEFRFRNEIVLEEDPHVAVRHAVPGDTTAPGSAVITSYDLNRITLNVSARQNAFLVLSEIYYPGWHASIDGNEAKVYRADWCLRAIPVLQGNHSVTVTFAPESFSRGLLITSATLFFGVVGLAVSRRKERRSRTPGTNVSA